jgi:hypothetical protein
MATIRTLIERFSSLESWAPATGNGKEGGLYATYSIGRQADVAFSELRTAGQKVYWIGAIGPHWVYGEIKDGQAPRPLIEWHDVTHDEESYRDFLNLVELVANLVGDYESE